jgi:DNA adenine methylase
MLFRYPGSKRKTSRTIVERILEIRDVYRFTCYCEPFFGGGAVCFRLLETVGFAIKTVWINDIDPGIYAIWWSVVNQPERFRELVHAFKPTREAFSRFKQELTNGTKLSLPQLALEKLAIHQMSYSGLGTMAGGPMSAIDSRWSTDWIDRNIEKARRLLAGKHLLVTKLDYRELLQDIDESTFLFLDPPYYEKGEVLYQYHFTKHDHEELRSMLEKAEFPWLLTYDDHSEIRRMYGSCTIREIPVLYSINGVAKKNELLITPKPASGITSHDIVNWNAPILSAIVLPISGYSRSEPKMLVDQL